MVTSSDPLYTIEMLNAEAATSAIKRREPHFSDADLRLAELVKPLRVTRLHRWRRRARLVVGMRP